MPATTNKEYNTCRDANKRIKMVLVQSLCTSLDTDKGDGAHSDIAEEDGTCREFPGVPTT